MDIRFDGRVALVTGAGGGLGRTYALELARRGARVVVNDFGGGADGRGAGSSMADAVVTEITAAGGEAIANYDSVSTPTGGEAMIRAAVERYGKIDIVINNAGILRDKTFVKLEPEDLEVVLDVHLKGAFYVTQPAFRVMREKGYGRILFTSSASGMLGNFGQSNYAAAKSGLFGLSNVLAVEGAKYGITSNVLTPVARTRLTEELLGAALVDHVKPECVTPLVVYLVSEECTATHRIFTAGGGRYAELFLGMTPGWFKAPGVSASVEEIGERFGQIADRANYSVPLSSVEEMRAIANLLRGRT